VLTQVVAGDDEEAKKMAAALLVRVTGDDVRTGEAEWKRLANTQFGGLSAGEDTPLLPSAVQLGAHQDALQQLEELPLEGFAVACPPLFRAKATAALAAQALEALQDPVHVARWLLPSSVSVLHSEADVDSYRDAATAAFSQMEDAGAAAGPVVGDVPADERKELLRAVLEYTEVYQRKRAAGLFSSEAKSDERGQPAASPANAFANWAFNLADATGCKGVIVFGTSDWWIQLVRELGGDLDAVSRDMLLPDQATQVTLPGMENPLSLPLVPGYCGSRYVRLVRARPGQFTLRLPGLGQGAPDTLRSLNPDFASFPYIGDETKKRDAWLEALLSAGTCQTF